MSDKTPWGQRLCLWCWHACNSLIEFRSLPNILDRSKGVEKKNLKKNPTTTTEQKHILPVSRGLVFTAFWEF